MKKYLLALALLASCTSVRSTYWTGFHGPAYLPARRPAVPALPTAHVKP